MTAKLQTLIAEIQELSLPEQWELIQNIKTFAQEDVWKSTSLEEIIASQGVLPITNIEDLAGNFWPENESADDFITYIYQQRREDLVIEQSGYDFPNTFRKNCPV
jgi:hypothetical protein